MNEEAKENQPVKRLNMASIMVGNINQVKQQLAEGASPSVEDLITAVEFNHTEIVKLLIDHGAVSAKGQNEGNDVKTPLYVAHLNIPIISCLISAGVDINAHYFKETALDKFIGSFLVTRGDNRDDLKKVVLLFLENGAEMSQDNIKIIERHLEKNIPVVKVSDDANGNPVYRQTNEQGEPMKTVQEKRSKKKYDAKFKECTYLLVAQSLFKTNKGVADAMVMGGLSQYLDKGQIRNASEASKVEDDQGNVSNSSLLKEADEKAKAFSLR
jgi:hypothetical protein